MIGIIDYGMGNLRSVFNALAYLGFDSKLVAEPDEVGPCDRVILPGVGAYASAMEHIHARGFDQALRAFVQTGRPLLGICLGMQLLSTVGYEPRRCDGLSLISGEVVPLPVSPSAITPHVGWNNLTVTREHPVFLGLRRDVDVYFVHSYCFQATRPGDVVGTCEYEKPFAAAVASGNVLGVQFHPEKSQVTGMKMLENFCQWDGQC